MRRGQGACYIAGTDLSHLALPGATFAVRAAPTAASAGITLDGGVIRIHVTIEAEGGKANAAVTKVLARAPGVAKG